MKKCKQVTRQNRGLKSEDSDCNSSTDVPVLRSVHNLPVKPSPLSSVATPRALSKKVKNKLMMLTPSSPWHWTGDKAGKMSSARNGRLSR